MRYRACSPTVCKYGWCGILAPVYACRLDMPRTERAFDELLDRLQAIIGRHKPRWRRSANAARNTNRGGINLAESVRVLDFYSARCTYTLDRVKERGVNTNIKRWLTTVPVSGKYIVHTARHAVFVHVPAVRGRWKLYDQTGVHSQRGFQATGSRGGIMFQKVVAVFTVVDYL